MNLWWITMQTILHKIWRCMLMMIIFIIFILFILFSFPIRQNSNLWPFWVQPCCRWLLINYQLFHEAFSSSKKVGHFKSTFSIWFKETRFLSFNFPFFIVIMLLRMYILSGFTNQDLKCHFKYAWCIMYYYANDGPSIDIQTMLFIERV